MAAKVEIANGKKVDIPENDAGRVQDFLRSQKGRRFQDAEQVKAFIAIARNPVAVAQFRDQYFPSPA